MTQPSLVKGLIEETMDLSRILLPVNRQEKVDTKIDLIFGPFFAIAFILLH